MLYVAVASETMDEPFFVLKVSSHFADPFIWSDFLHIKNKHLNVAPPRDFTHYILIIYFLRTLQAIHLPLQFLSPKSIWLYF